MDPKIFGQMAADLLEQSIGASQGLEFPTPPTYQEPMIPQDPAAFPQVPMEPFQSTLEPLPMPEAPPDPQFYEPPPADYMQPEQPPAFMSLDDSLPPPAYPEQDIMGMGPLRRDPQFNPKVNY